jgi:predicted MFS family arabinose efflux permease
VSRTDCSRKSWKIALYLIAMPTLSSSSTAPSSAPAPDPFNMTPLERRASLSLASIYALRLLGLFLVLPVFALEAARYPGGDDPARVGLAMGIYGLTQGLLQIPFGIASDWWGRKPVMIFGLLVFAMGSGLATWAPDLDWLIAGRALQGAGAISAAVSALIADFTRDEVRTKAMTLVGGSITIVFALSLVLGPLLTSLIGFKGLFALTALLALAGMAVVMYWVPAEPAKHPEMRPGGLATVLKDPSLLRLDFGVFVLHAVQLAMWVAIPALLVSAGLDKAQHWQIYLPVIVASFLIMWKTLYPLERRGYLRAALLAAMGVLFLVQLGFLGMLRFASPSLSALGLLLLVFFCGFNVLEASQPSLASRLAQPHARGAALGVYNTLQSLGFFVGGAVGGWITKVYGVEMLFMACAGLMLLWLVVAWPMKAPSRQRKAPTVAHSV